jgi:hypothetical protein
MEILIGMAVGGVFVIGTATIIASSLHTSQQVSLVQGKAELANEMVNNVQAWAAGNWSGVLALATGTTNTYILNTTSSPFSVATSSSGGSSMPVAIALVQSESSTAEYQNSGFSSITARFDSNTMTGDTIIVVIQNGTHDNDVSGCRDTINATSSYVRVGDAWDASSAQGQSIWYAPNITGGATPTVTCTFSMNAYFDSIAIYEFSGVATSSPLDVVSTTVLSSASTAWTTGTSTTNTNGELVFGSFVGTNFGSETFTPGAGFTAGVDNGVVAGLYNEYEIQPSAGPVSAFATSNTGDYQANIMGTFEAQTTSGGVASYATGTESISLGGVSYNRSFYLSDVYRDSNGNVTSTVAGNNYDPSTKLVTVVVAASTTPATTPMTLSFYLTRNQNNTFNQTNWAGGGGQTTPVTVVGTNYADATGISVSATGSIELSIGGGSCVL